MSADVLKLSDCGLVMSSMKVILGRVRDPGKTLAENQNQHMTNTNYKHVLKTVWMQHCVKKPTVEMVHEIQYTCIDAIANILYL